MNVKVTDMAVNHVIWIPTPDGSQPQTDEVLYPNDDTREGKILRFKQQYFFCAASLADIVKKQDVYKRQAPPCVFIMSEKHAVKYPGSDESAKLRQRGDVYKRQPLLFYFYFS